MGLIRTPWTRQPQVAVGVDSSVLSYYTPFSEGRLTKSGTTSRVVAAGMQGFLVSGDGQYDAIAPIHSKNKTLVFVGRFSSSSFGSMGLTNASTYESMLYSSVSNNPYFFYASGANLGNTAVDILGKFVVMVGSWDGATARLGVRTLDNNAIYITSSVASGAGATCDRVRFGNIFDTGDMTCFFGAVLGTSVSDVGVRSLLENPWQLFAPLSRQIWVGPSAVSTYPVLSAAGYVPGSITSSAMRPRVTITVP